MYKRILIARWFRALPRKPEAMGLELAKTLNAEAIAVTVTEPAEEARYPCRRWPSALMSDPIGGYEESVSGRRCEPDFFRVGETAMRLWHRLQEHCGM